MSPVGKWPVLISCVQFDEALRDGTRPIAEVAPIARRLGADGVEYREVYWHNKQDELPRVRDQIRDLGLMVTYATFTALYNRDKEARRQLLTDIEDAHQLGSPLLRVFRGEKPGVDDDDMREGARAAIQLARSHGMTLALENFARTPANRLVDVRDALETLNDPVMGTNLDTGNYIQNGENLMDAIRTLSPWLAYSHIKDVIDQSEFATTYIGNGKLDWRAILGAYEDSGRTFPLCFEFGGGGDSESAISRSIEHLRSIVKSK
ncbi:MAG TPA: sugar phosphate isomerase/epimerase family protein [Chloroflexota bacterium]|nr:sugar phosphate isomerase/epimerase family protein [Chloroflexota bacterium]